MVTSSALVVVGGGWSLGGPGTWGPVIGGAVCGVVAMTKIGGRALGKNSLLALRAAGTQQVLLGSVAGWWGCSGTPW